MRSFSTPPGVMLAVTIAPIGIGISPAMSVPPASGNCSLTPWQPTQPRLAMFCPGAICSGVPSTLMFGTGIEVAAFDFEQADGGDHGDRGEDEREQPGQDDSRDLDPEAWPAPRAP